jgi:F-type H+-transporting ATPase subunit b
MHHVAPLVGASSPLTKIIPGLMIWTLVFFVIVLYVLKRYAFGPIQNMIDERRESIRKAIQEADHAREEARSLLEEHRKLIGQAKSEGEEILAEARRIADAQRDRVREETEEDRHRRLEETRRQIDQATQQALGQIREEGGRLSLAAAEKIVQKSLTDADQQRLIDEALAEIDFSRLEGSTVEGSRS